MYNNTRNPPPAMVNQYSSNRRNPMYNSNTRNPPPAMVKHYLGNRRNLMYNNNTRNPPPAMVKQYSGNRRNLMYNNNTINPPPAMVNQYSGNRRNPMYNNTRNAPPAMVNQYTRKRRNLMHNNTRNMPPAMVNQYSGNRRNFCCNNPRNRLAAPAINHNLQYPNSRRNIWRSNYRRNRQSNNRFTRTRILRQSFYRTNWVHCCNGRRTTWQHAIRQPYTRVTNHAIRNNPRQLDGSWGSERFNHFEGRRFRNSQPYSRDLINSDRNNPRWLDECERYHNSSQNNNSNLFHNITEHDMGQQPHNLAQDGYNVSDPLPERYLAEDCVNLYDDVPEEGTEYAHADRNCQDPPLENDNIAEEDLAANQISDT